MIQKSHYLQGIYVKFWGTVVPVYVLMPFKWSFRSSKLPKVAKPSPSASMTWKAWEASASRVFTRSTRVTIYAVGGFLFANQLVS